MRLNVAGLPGVEGVIDAVLAPHVVGAHTADGIVMVCKGYRNVLIAEYHGFSGDEDAKEVEAALRTWLGTAFVSASV